MSMKRLAVLAMVAGLAAQAKLPAHAQPKPVGDAQDDRAFALTACTGCHVVTPDQPFKPLYAGDAHPPAF